MINVRALAEQDLAHTLEGECGLPITLIYKDGSRQTLTGRVLWSQPRTNLETGETVVVPDPIISIRRSRLTQASDNIGAVIAPSGPRADAPVTAYKVDPTTKAAGGDKSLGILTLPLVIAEQAEAV